VTTLQDVRLALMQEDAAQVALGKLPCHKVSMTMFLITGFELEDSQYIPYDIFYLIGSDFLSDIFCIMRPRR